MAHKEYQRKKHFCPGRCYLHDKDGVRGHAQGQGRWGISLAAAFWARHAFPRPGLKDTRELPPHDGNCSVKERVIRFLLKKSLLAKHPRWIRSDFKRQMSSHSGHGKAASQEFQIVTLCEAGGTGWSPGEGAGHGGPRVLWAGPFPRFPRFPRLPHPRAVGGTAEGAASPWPELGTAENRFSSPAVAATCLSGPLPEPKFQSDAFFQIMTSKATVVN